MIRKRRRSRKNKTCFDAHFVANVIGHKLFAQWGIASPVAPFVQSQTNNLMATTVLCPSPWFPFPMALLTTPTGPLLRQCARQRLASVPITAITAQRRHRSQATFDSPFKTIEHDTTKIPDFGHYMSKRGEASNKVFQYFMAGTMGALAAAGAKATVQGSFGHFPAYKD
jgi:hypothetical protein